MKHLFMTTFSRWTFFCLSGLLLLAGNLAAQQPAATNIRNAKYPAISSDNRVTLRIKAPEAQQVKAHIGSEYNMVRDSEGVWSVTTEPLQPGFHPYFFEIGGVHVNDPASETFFTMNRWVSGIDIPDPSIDFYDIKDVPHGELIRVPYFSEESGNWRRLFIYTPPGYHSHPDKRYPVLYIQHGAGENETSWAIQGKLDLILDNLIAEGKAVPMMAVISDDYLEESFGRGYNTPTTNAFFDRFGRDLTGSIIPFIEKNYRAIPHREQRALTGLSMGGGISFRIGLHNLDTFANVGVFSTSSFRGQGDDIFDIEAQIPGLLSNPEAFNKKLNLFYISNGEQDHSFKYTLKTVDTLRKHGVKVELQTFPGVHEWEVWRKALHDFASKLFK